jgi:hypothetical protein
LESVCWGNSTVGSNPTLSAIPKAISASNTIHIRTPNSYIFVALDCNLTHRFRYDPGVPREEVRSVKCDRSAYPRNMSAVFLFHSDRKLGNDNFARDAEFAEYVVDAGRRESEIRRLDIRPEFIGKEEV